VGTAAPDCEFVVSTTSSGYSADLTSGKTFTESSSYHAGTVGAQSFDDNTSTHWGADGNSSTEWIKVDFGSGVTKTITKISVQGQLSGWNGIKDFKLQGNNTSSDTTGWVDIFTKTGHPNNEVKYEYVVSNSTAYRYYRIYITAAHGGNWLAVREVEMMESGGAAYPLKVDGDNVLLANLPTEDPNVVGGLWNDGNTLKVSTAT
jgi:hypothetical protein